MADLSPIAPRLAKLLPMLGTERDGEALAAVRAIHRTLRGAGCDWHDLTKALTVSLPAPKPAGCSSRRSADDTPPTHDPADWHGMAKWARDNDHGRLSDRERRFITDMAAPLRMRRGFKPSAKQLDWLRSIYWTLRNWID